MLKITNKSQFMNYLLVIGAIVILGNVVSKNLFFRWDATDNKMYSLSESSKEVISKLKETLTAKVYFSDNLPGQYANSRRYVQDMLEEYQAFSDGRFTFEFINPEADEKIKQQAQGYQIPPVQLQAIENDKMEVKNVYMGMVLLYGDKKETIPVIQTTDGLEYTITATIKKVSVTNLKSIGMISNEGEDISTQNLKRFLEQIYQVQEVTLGSEIPANVQTLLIHGIKDSLKGDELYHLDQFLMRGGKLFIGQNSIKDMFQQGFGIVLNSNIFAALEHYGISVSKELVTDRRCSQIQMQSQQGFFMVRNAVDYPPFPMIQKFNPDHVLTRKMTIARLFFANEVTASKTSDARVSFTPLMFTSEKTGVIDAGKGFVQLSPMNNPMLKMFPFGQKAVAALVEGTMTSFYKDSGKYVSRPGFISSTNSGQIILISDGQFFNDKRAGSVQENSEFVLNSVDYLSGDKELIALRARSAGMKPLGELSDASRKSWKWSNIFLPSALVLVFGLFQWRRMKQKRKMLEDMYA